jgi:acyl-CoA synthetase (AMP-forming)/AMP-acid ligase II
MGERPECNVADVCEAFARARPEATAVVQGHHRVSWGEFDRRAGGVAAALLGAGLDRQDRVALYLHNTPEYLEAFVAATKASFVPVNTNYRYADDELRHLWNDADAAAVVFHGRFADTAERVRRRVPTVRLWLWVDDGTGPCPSWAVPFEAAAALPSTSAPWERSAHDLVFVYTGGTTGLPKGVMWEQSTLVAPGVAAGGGTASSVEEHVARCIERDRVDVVLPAPPLMHGTGMMTALRGLLNGGTVALLPGGRFEAVALLDTLAAEQVVMASIVGDAFGRPTMEALDTQPGRWDLSALRVLMSAGAMFSEPVKRGILAHVPHVLIVDQLGSSENAGAAFSYTGADTPGSTAAFRPEPGVRVLAPDGRDVEPGSGEVGVIAIPGGAVGYHKDPVKTAATFPVIDGVRYTVAGDHATIEADGTLRLLGRGSVCINTGGEKVFPEEVEEALKTHPSIRDAVVVGVPDPRMGEAIAAAVELADQVGEAELIEHVKGRLARYKAPRHVIGVESVGRAPNGKADYPATRALVLERLGVERSA